MRILLIAALSCCFAFPSFAQSPYLAADLKTTPDELDGSDPSWRAAVNGAALFVVTRFAGEGGQLWRTDGTAAGTFRLLTLGEGPIGDIFGVLPGNGVVYFGAFVDGAWRIFRTDGTVAGTVAVSPVSDAPISPRAILGNRILYYVNFTPTEVGVLENGQLRNLITLRTSRPFATVTSGVVWNGAFYAGTEGGLRKTDGTPAGSMKISDQPSWALAVHKNALLFASRTNEAGSGLWTTDGTAAGMRMISNLVPISLTLAHTRSIGEAALFFGAGGQIAVTDGTSAGTRVLRTGRPYTNIAPRITDLNGIGYFAFDDGETGRELWRSDGTEAGTFRLTDTVEPPVESAVTRYTTILPYVAGATKIYFWAWPDASDDALFESDGTVAGTRRVAAAEPSTKYTNKTLVTIGDTVFYSGFHEQFGAEPWIAANGTTRVIANVSPETVGSSDPRRIVAGSDRLYFIAQTNRDTAALWSSDGTVAGSRILAEAAYDYELPAPLVAAGGTGYFAKEDQLWKSDGTSEGIVLVKDFDGRIDAGHVAGGRVYIAVGGSLWTTDGTEAGTIRLGNMDSNVVAAAGQTYFFNDGVLYATDGTIAGTHAVGRSPRRSHATLVPLGAAVLLIHGGETWKLSTVPGEAAVSLGMAEHDSFAQLGTSLLFVRGGELFRTDGTPAGTERLAQIAPPPVFVSTPVTLGARAVFVQVTPEGAALWASDGTAAGTRRIRELGSIGVSDIFAAGGLAYFAAGGDATGLELWQTDGTPEGTRLLGDIWPGRESSHPQYLTRLGDTLYFTASTPDTGSELWAYPLPANPSVTIDDVRVSEAAKQATVTVRLTGAPNRPLSVSYETADDTAKAGRDFTAASGTLTFQAGETSKSVTIPIADDTTAGAATRAFFVKVSSADAPVERTAAAVAIEDDDLAADVSLALDGDSLNVTNAGPSLASDVVLCGTFGVEEYTCTAPRELLPGELWSLALSSRSMVVARVTHWERDPNPANNESSWLRNGIIVEPAVPRAGTAGTLRLPAGATSVSSSDTSVISVSAIAPNGTATFTAHKAGSAVITSGAFSVAVRVIGASEPLRLPVSFDGLRGGGEFGKNVAIAVTVRGTTADGARPTGTVTLLDGTRVVGTQALADGRATLILRYERPGTRSFTLRYGGDANFLDGSAAVRVDISPIAASFTAIRQESGDVLIIARGVPGFAPSGTLNGRPLVPFGDSSTVTVTGMAVSARTIHVGYTGDAYYRAEQLTIPIQEQRRRAARH